MSNVTKITDRPRGTVVVDPNAKPARAEDYIRLRFGMSLPELIKDMHENRDGKYDCLFVKEA